MKNHIVTATLERLPEEVTTEEIHQTIINVCLEKEEVEYSRVAAELEMASIYKNMEQELKLYKPTHATFVDILEIMDLKGLWKPADDSDTDWIVECYENEDLVNEWFVYLESVPLEYWTVKQWSDKYSIKINGKAVETPAAGCLALAISYHGVTDLAFSLAKDLIESRANLPTPALNGCRNGDFNSISCCVIEGGDSVASIDTAEHIASRMTAKKAGIGITLDTRSKGDPVKGGAVKHLGKQPLFKAIEASVKKYTQLSRGGSATVTFKCIDPEITSMLLWKTQKIDLSQRIDKVDYSLAYNFSFVKAVIDDDDWYLLSKYYAPEVHDNFHTRDFDQYVRNAIRRGVPYKKVKAREVLKLFIEARGETGRLYCINVSTANYHTPFMDTIKQSNLCMEICLPTKPYLGPEDLYNSTKSVGETAFCALAAANVSKLLDEPKEEVAQFYKRILRTVDRMIDNAPMLSPSMRESLLRRRSIGIGITGLASALYMSGLDYDGSEESLEFVADIAEQHMFYLYKASIEMAEEDGIIVEGVDFNWLPIDTKFTSRQPKLDWESLRGKPRKHSVLVAHMPTESSAVFSNATNGVYPTRNRVVYKKARQGKVQFISEYFVNKLPAWDVDMVPYYREIQAYTDQAISADYYMDLTKMPNKKVPETMYYKWFVEQALSGIKTCYYLNFLDTKGTQEKEETCESGGCKL
jgi:ribonucleoside-diphosphate reductase alpha chain